MLPGGLHFCMHSPRSRFIGASRGTALNVSFLFKAASGRGKCVSTIITLQRGRI